jgi:uncharacterized damage-inducible protein DinB
VSIFTNPASRSPEQAAAYAAAVQDLLGPSDPLAVLEDTVRAIERILAPLADAQVRRPEAPGKWSVLQVVHHLADAELMWGYRLRLVLGQDRPSLTGFDQDQWAERLRYHEADAEGALEDFAAFRRANLRLLRRMSAHDLKRVGIHVERGEESAEKMLSLWAGHDLLHLQQLARIQGAK